MAQHFVVQKMATNLIALPQDWPQWPILSLVRIKPDDDFDVGFLYDLFHHKQIVGYSSTVFICNVFQRPRDIRGLLALPKEIYDTPEEIVAAGWRPDR